MAELYEFDRDLKGCIQTGLERVEVALRSQIGHQLGSIDPLAHLDAGNFRTTFSHSQWVATAQRRITRARGRDDFVDHHFAAYGGRLPIWVLTDVLDFSDLSKLYAGMKAHDQRPISEWFTIAVAPGSSKNARRLWARKPPLTNWLEHLVVVRNICAHHGRLWNRQLPPIGVPHRARHLDAFVGVPPDQDQIERVYGTIRIIGQLLRAISPVEPWEAAADHLITGSIDRTSIASRRDMGFPHAAC